VNSALNMEMREIENAVRAANAAVTRGEWAAAERALAKYKIELPACCARLRSSKVQLRQ
jgi:hypothetical protein